MRGFAYLYNCLRCCFSDYTGISIAPETDKQVAQDHGVDIRHLLNRTYGYGNWRKMKGVAIIQYENGTIWRSELHWYEAANIGRHREKVKRDLEKLR
jgi:hypothetical protein